MPEDVPGKRKAVQPKRMGTRMPDHADQPGWLSMRVHGSPGGRRNSWAWLIVSIAVHLLALIVLAGMRFGAGHVEEKAPDIEIQTDIVETFRAEPKIYRTQVDVSKAQSAAERAAQLRRALLGDGDQVPVMDVDALDLGGIGADLMGRKKQGRDTDMPGGAELTGKVNTGTRRDYQSVLDNMAREVLDRIEKRRLLIVILFDESQSLLDDRKLVSAQLEQTFADLMFSMSDKQEKRLKWAVVSFSSAPRMCLPPTRSVEKVRGAIAKMRIDRSGKENVLGGVNYCVRELSREAERMFILLVTDEQGDDVGLEADAPPRKRRAMKEAVAVCRDAKTAVFVLGREAMLNHGNIWTHIPGLKAPGWLMRGLSGCRQETPTRHDWLRMNLGYVPSGYGTYSLSLLAARTNGAYFILSDKKSPYGEKAIKPYEPEYVYPDEYDTRVRESAVRSEINDILSHMYDGLWHHWEFCKPDWSMQVQRLQQIDHQYKTKLAWVDGKIQKLLALEKQVRKEKHARKRWEANFDLTLAHLYKMQAQIMQFRAHAQFAMKQKGFPKRPPRDPKKGMILYMRPALPDDRKAKFIGGSAARSSMRKAHRACAIVQRKHGGTPWAARAKIEDRNILPVRWEFRIVDLPYPPPYVHPEYPKL